MKAMLAALIGALALVAIGPAGAFDVHQYRLVDLSHAYDSQTLYWLSRPPMKFELERLVLTDLQMPGMDGIRFLRAAQETDPNLVGIVMTGHGALDAAIEAMKAGALDYILKPFKLSSITPVLSRALAIRVQVPRQTV